jgi:hypothetical protein
MTMTIDDERKTGLLTLKRISRVAFVQRGANQHAHISFVKSADDVDNRATKTPERKETGMTATQQLEAKAADIRKADDSLSQEQAISKAMDEHPDLVAAYYDNEFGNEPEPLEKTEPEPTEIEKADADIVAIQKAHGENSAEFCKAMAKRCDLLGHVDQAEDWRKQAAFL